LPLWVPLPARTPSLNKKGGDKAKITKKMAWENAARLCEWLLVPIGTTSQGMPQCLKVLVFKQAKALSSAAGKTQLKTGGHKQECPRIVLNI
jgi:ferric iron reductase protein FhuF